MSLNYYEPIKNKILFMKETIIKRCLSLKSNRVHLLILKTVYTVNQSIKSVIKKKKEDSRTQRFLYWFTHQTGYVQSLTHSKHFTKTDQLIKFITLAHDKTTLHSQQPLLNLQQTKKPHRVHCAFQDLPC